MAALIGAITARQKKWLWLRPQLQWFFFPPDFALHQKLTTPLAGVAKYSFFLEIPVSRSITDHRHRVQQWCRQPCVTAAGCAPTRTSAEKIHFIFDHFRDHCSLSQLNSVTFDRHWILCLADKPAPIHTFSCARLWRPKERVHMTSIFWGLKQWHSASAID